MNHLIEAMRHHSIHRGNELALRFLHTGEVDGPRTEMTFSQLYKGALRVAGKIQQTMRPGDRALLLYQGGFSFIEAICGCMMAGVISVPSYPPDPRRLHRTLPRLQSICDDAGASHVLTSSQILKLAEGLRSQAHGLGQLQWLATDEESDCTDTWTSYHIEPDNLAYLQYTSGSTGNPKGVMVSHRNLRLTWDDLLERHSYDDESHLVTWLPTFHDLGLIWGIMLPLYRGVSATFMPPTAFLQRPARWLEAISRFRGTHTAAPNFGFELCLRKTDDQTLAKLDLSSLRIATNCAEPVRKTTVEAFQSRFSKAGLGAGVVSSGYGLAEATLLASFGDEQDGPLDTLELSSDDLESSRVVLQDGGTPVVGCGKASPNVEVAIVEPETATRLSGSRVGEIWLNGPMVALGYWNRPEQSEEIFNARISGEGDVSWLRTGDLGFMHKDRLFITGRQKDLIIVRGRNIYPQDIEQVVELAHPAVRMGCSAAFPIVRCDGEQVGLVAEIDPKKLKGSPDTLLGPIRNAVAREFNLQLHTVALIPPRTIYKTSSGKIQRRRNRQALQNEELRLLAKWTTTVKRPPGQTKVTRPDTIRSYLWSLLEEHPELTLPALSDPHMSFRELGLDSVSAVEISGKISEHLGRSLPPTLLFDYPTIHALCEYLRPSRVAITADPVVSNNEAEPIAIVGMGCRFPGGADSPASFWELLEQGRDAITAVPPERWNTDAWYDPDPDAQGKMTTRWGGFLKGLEDFDPLFFGISPREAKSVDPQERLLLECTWEALERAGFTTEQLRNSPTGVFMGLCGTEYQHRTIQDAKSIDAYSLLGTAHSTIVGRLSYWMGLRGPNIPIDTACSSSLVAVHLACQSLRAGECSLGLAGGANVVLSPESNVYFSRLRAMSPTGRCHTFSDNADGYVRSEGAGVILLERLSDAKRKGHTILAVIRGSAINQDGRSQGLTAPNGPAQQEVIREALRRGGVEPASIDYLECHGTGTPLGDPIEVRAAAEALGTSRTSDNPLLLGSVKSNIGHTEAAAGIGGLIKTVLALQKGKIPKSLHSDTLNSHIPWEKLPVRVVTHSTDWPELGEHRRAGVSSFGFSGTNAHVVLEEAPKQKTSENNIKNSPLPFLLSGISQETVLEQAAHLAEHLRLSPEISLCDVAHTLAHGRSRFEHRGAVVACNREELLRSLDKLVSCNLDDETVLGCAQRQGRIVFVFPGQGAQWLGMARVLLEESSVFRNRIASCEKALRPFVKWSLIDVLKNGSESLMERTDIVQPALWATMLALADIWTSWGIRPDAVLGHSQGEIAAATFTGALSLKDGARVAALRSRIIVALEGLGSMASVTLPKRELQARLVPFGKKLSIAASNSSSQTLVSGQPGALETLIKELEDDGIFARPIAVNFASHCAQVEPLRETLLELLRPITPRKSAVPLYSTVYSEVLTGDELDASYWYENLRKPVRFLEATRLAIQDGTRHFVEISGHPVLTVALRRTMEDEETSGTCVGTLRRGQGSMAQMLRSLCKLHSTGHPIDWTRVLPAGKLVDLPTYPFQRARYWLERAPQTDATTAGFETISHPLLGHLVEQADGSGYLITTRVSLDDHRWLGDHCVFGSAILAGTVFLELALAVGEMLDRKGIHKLTLVSPLVLDAPRQLQIRIGSEGQDFSVYSRSEKTEAWKLHATGQLGFEPEQARKPLIWPTNSASPVSVDDLYRGLEKAGYHYGPAFRLLREAWQENNTVIARVALPNGDNLRKQQMAGDQFHIHPALLDACLHTLSLFLKEGYNKKTLSVPHQWSGVALRKAFCDNELLVRLSRDDDHRYRFSIDLFDRSGKQIGSIRQLTLRSLSAAQLGISNRDLHKVRWKSVALDSQQSDFEPLEFQVPEVEGPDRGAAAQHIATTVLADLQRALTDESEERPLIWLTGGAVSTGPGDPVSHPAQAVVSGILRSAQREYPKRNIRLIDIDRYTDSEHVIAAKNASWPELALRHGQSFAPQLCPIDENNLGLTPPSNEPCWRASRGKQHGVNHVQLIAHDAATRPLDPKEIRISVRAAGQNFRDVLGTLGMLDDPSPLGLEGAGVVREVGQAVLSIKVGDRVFGLLHGGAGTHAITSQKLVRPIPEHLSFYEAATIPVNFLTAYYALRDLGNLCSGERVLIHAATGGTGMAAMQLAKHFEAEIYGTASPAKHHLLLAAGLDHHHIASSRDQQFESQFLRTTEGAGIDVVLNSLTGDLLESSMRLLAPGGRFLELGVSADSDPARLATGVQHFPIVLSQLGEAHLGQLLESVTRLFEAGILRPLPFQVHDLRHLPATFLKMTQGRHTGKLLLAPPRQARVERTVLITGGTGQLGQEVARHLVQKRGFRRILLVSRQGADSAGAPHLCDELKSLGASVRIESCDVTDPDSLKGVLGSEDLGGVIHCAGVLDDGMIPGQSEKRLAQVFAPKVLGAWNLHQLTRKMDLDFFVLFSSLAGVMGSPGQSTYGGANCFLDALASFRRAGGLAGQSLAWGLWEPQERGMTSHLAEAERMRLKRLGLQALSVPHGLALLDSAMAEAHDLLVPAHLAAEAIIKPEKRDFSHVTESASDRKSSDSLLLEGLSGRERREALDHFVRQQIATVLALPNADLVPGDKPMSDLGLDSLMSVELLNRISTALNTRLNPKFLLDFSQLDDLVNELDRLQDGCSASQERLSEPENLKLKALSSDRPLVNAHTDEAKSPVLPVVSHPSDSTIFGTNGSKGRTSVNFRSAGGSNYSVHDVVDQVVTDAVKRGSAYLSVGSDRLKDRKFSLNGDKCINFGSCSYLGLEFHPLIKAGVIDAVERYGSQFSSTRTFLSLNLYEELEALLRQMFSRPVLVGSSTTLTHMSAFSVLIDDRDAIIFDIQAHNSLHMAGQLPKARGVPTYIVRHNDLNEVESLVKQLKVKHRRIWYVIDGTYSIFGDTAPAKGVTSLLDRHNSLWTYVDDAHGFSWAGAKGVGVVRREIAHHPKMLLAVSLNKSFAAAGGALVFPNEELCRRVRLCGPTMIFSGPIQPPMLGAAVASAKLHLTDELSLLQEELSEKIRHTHRRITDAGLPLYGSGTTPLFFVPAGSIKIVNQVVDRLIADGLLVGGTIFPIVPMHQGGIRITITRANSIREIDYLVDRLSHHYRAVVGKEPGTMSRIATAFGRPDWSTLAMGCSDLVPKAVPSNGRKSLTVRVEKSIMDFDPEHWDSIFGDRGPFNHASLRMMEQVFGESGAEHVQQTFRYFSVSDASGRNVAATFATAGLMKEDVFAPANVSEKIEHIRSHENSRYLVSRAVALGTPITTGEHLFIDLKHPEWKKALALLARELDTFKLEQNCNQIHLRDFRQPAELLRDELLNLGFVERKLLDTMEITHVSWANREEFLRLLSSRYRYNVRKEMVAFEDRYELLTDSQCSLAEIERCYKLYRSVHERGLALNVFPLPLEYFIMAFRHPDYDILRLRLRSDKTKETVGVMLSHNFRGQYTALVVGFAKEINLKHKVYKQLLFQTVERAHAQGARKLSLGFTAELEKKKLGARPVPTSAFVSVDDLYAASVIESMA